MKKIFSVLLSVIIFISAVNLSSAGISAQTAEQYTSIAAEEFTLTSDDFQLEAINNCKVDGNSLTVSNQYPQFTINLKDVFLVYEIELNLSIQNDSGYGYRINPDTLKFMYRGENTGAAFGGNNSTTFASGQQTAIGFTTPSEYMLSAVDGLKLLGGFTGEVTNAAITVVSVKVVGIRLTEQVTLTGSDISAAVNHNCTVSGNVITSAANQYPNFYVSLDKDYYIRTVEITATAAGQKYIVNKNNNPVKLRYDKTDVYVLPWSATWSVGTQATKSADVPEENYNSTVNRINFAGYWGSAPTKGGATLTIDAITMSVWIIPQEGGLLNTLLQDILNRINSPVYQSSGQSDYEQLPLFYRNWISDSINGYTYSPLLLSATVDNSMQYGLEGTPVVSVEIPFISYDISDADYYIQELGIIAMQTDVLGENELTLNTDGVISVRKDCVKDENLSDFASFTAPIVLGIDYANVQLKVRAYVIYTDGENSTVYYSNNITEDETVTSGMTSVTFPDTISYTGSVGDANSDDEFNILDLIRLKKHLADITVDITLVGADANADGVVNSLDLSEMRKALLGIAELPQEPYINEFLESDIWITAIDGREFSKNMTGISFNESDWADVNYYGGTDVRTEDYTRGMGLTAWHATEHYNLSDETKAIDTANLEELNVTSKRTWGEALQGTMNTDYDYTTNMNLSSVLDKQTFADGTLAGAAYKLNTLNSAASIINSWTSLLTDPLVRTQNRLLLIGNEYRTYSYNSTTAKYEYSGYDDVTLTAFRNAWLPSRFGTVEVLNSLCGTSYSSFSEVYPEISDKLLFYEFWLFQRNTFRTVMGDVVSGMKNTYSDTAWGYAAYAGINDPLGDNLYLDCLDYSSQNLYYMESYMKDFHGYSFQMDNLAAWSQTAPVMITEIGFKNGFTDESKSKAARQYKQALNLLYMRPRIVGSYIFNYTTAGLPDENDANTSWGMVDPYRNKYPSYYAVKQVYSHFKLLDGIYTGASLTPLVAISNLVTDNRVKGASASSMDIASVLYSKGVPIQVVPSDDSARFDSLEEMRLIFNDSLMYQNPDGSNSVSTALAGYLNKGGKVFRTNNEVPTSLYGIKGGFDADNTEELTALFSGLTVSCKGTDEKASLWNELGEFIHKDFVSGNVAVKENTIDENAVRVLDVEAFSNSLNDKTYDIETKMVYKNGDMYLCLVNTGDTAIDKVDITLGVNNGVKCNLSPDLICGDDGTSVELPHRAYMPSWIDASIESAVEYGTVTVTDLDTYAYIHLGKAVISD